MLCNTVVFLVIPGGRYWLLCTFFQLFFEAYYLFFYFLICYCHGWVWTFFKNSLKTIKKSKLVATLNLRRCTFLCPVKNWCTPGVFFTCSTLLHYDSSALPLVLQNMMHEFQTTIELIMFDWLHDNIIKLIFFSICVMNRGPSFYFPVNTNRKKKHLFMFSRHN